MHVCDPHPPPPTDNPSPPPPSRPRQRHLARLRLPGPKGQRSLSATTFNAGLEPDVQVRLFLVVAPSYPPPGPIIVESPSTHTLLKH